MIKKPRVQVSDHAVIRYLERVPGMDVETIRREIGRKVDRGADLGACGVQIGGFVYKIRDGVVTTVLLASQPETGQRQVARRGERDE
ncbi:hypothetical protein [Maritimibacter sp. HL-12]|uniref:hypothetical protein n=1 Tax=Maritimibacter sp. HL-12 TaxID=1162418 RepID=UPI000A0F3638|nr:hypothetical protein [Maritimibacter sp. HL-12]SMH35978.1 hypothetical protein SAMN05661107_0670 [Maritimibacter sp. HL-12]